MVPHICTHLPHPSDWKEISAFMTFKGLVKKIFNNTAEPSVHILLSSCTPWFTSKNNEREYLAYFIFHYYGRRLRKKVSGGGAFLGGSVG